jgi:glycosyltransferase involved in cell wall biosynthesis
MVAKPRLLCVMQLPPPVHGVTAINAQIASSAVLAARFELEIVPVQLSDTIAELGTVSAKKLARASVTAARLVWHLKRRRPAALYLTLAPQRPALYRDLSYLALAKAAGVRRIVHLHARPEPAVRSLLAWGLRDAHVILLSPALRADLGDAVPDDRIHYVPNGIPDAGEPAPRRATPRVLFLSNLIAEKGPLVLAQALDQLAARGLAVEATFAGAPGPDAGLAARLGARAIGPVAGEAKHALFRDHDIFVLPTERDAFPVVLLEAMQHGLAVVTTRVGAIPELVGDAGILVPPADPGALAEALHRVIADRELRERLGARARARYLEHYTLARFEHALAGALAACLAE